jgi:hypothetical protein
MMITYVLLMVLATHDGKPIGVETAYFQGKKSCELAAMKVQQDLGRKFDVSVVWAAYDKQRCYTVYKLTKKRALQMRNFYQVKNSR